MVSGLEWKDSLLNKSSTYFKIASSKIANEVQYSYRIKHNKKTSILKPRIQIKTRENEL